MGWTVSDHGASTWLPTVIGFLVFGGLRLLDWLMPRGWHSIWAERHGRPNPRKGTDEQDDT